jgi:hypothetical protein
MCFLVRSKVQKRTERLDVLCFLQIGRRDRYVLLLFCAVLLILPVFETKENTGGMIDDMCGCPRSGI